jgi:hypothetical protein
MTTTTSTPLKAEKPTIKILLYTDDPEIAPTNDPGQLFGLGSMLDRLHAHTPSFANIETRWISRNPDADHHATNKLDAILQNENFDEIWFFGMHQSNTDRFSLGERRGGPESELNQAEVEALTEWMRVREDGCGGGGILMTGDHSNETPDNLLLGKNSLCPDKTAGETFLGLGRALGRCVPRAGSLRKWEGPPSYRPEDSLSTIFKSGFQLDPFPQQLQLRSVNADGDPDPNGQPHPLFFYKQGRYIEVFPDHAHEGAIITPPETAQLDPAVWPAKVNGLELRPHVVAFGRDARRRDPLNIIATYNGDLAGVGRIVADSTWHHYMNVNLTSFPHPAPDGSDSDQIGQFYGNLAVWLAPRCKRQQMAQAMLYQLALYTILLEPGLDAESTGASAESVLARVASPCEIHESWRAFTPRQVVEWYEAHVAASELPSRNLLLGSVLKSYHSVMFKAQAAEASTEAAVPSVENTINAGFDSAFTQHVKQLRSTLDAFSSLVEKQ